MMEAAARLCTAQGTARSKSASSKAAQGNKDPVGGRRGTGRVSRSRRVRTVPAEAFTSRAAAAKRTGVRRPGGFPLPGWGPAG